MNHHDSYLGRRLISSKFIVLTYRHTHTRDNAGPGPLKWSVKWLHRVNSTDCWERLAKGSLSLTSVNRLLWRSRHDAGSWQFYPRQVRRRVCWTILCSLPVDVIRNHVIDLRHDLQQLHSSFLISLTQRSYNIAAVSHANRRRMFINCYLLTDHCVCVSAYAWYSRVFMRTHNFSTPCST